MSEDLANEKAKLSWQLVSRKVQASRGTNKHFDTGAPSLKCQEAAFLKDRFSSALYAPYTVAHID